jgi:hypothetical protein
LHALSSFQRTKDIRDFQPEFPPQDALSNILDIAPALFGGTFQSYDDYPSLVNPFFATGENFGPDFLGRHNALDQEHRVNRVSQR